MGNIEKISFGERYESTLSHADAHQIEVIGGEDRLIQASLDWDRIVEVREIIRGISNATPEIDEPETDCVEEFQAIMLDDARRVLPKNVLRKFINLN
ncbi:MAG: hypothetical protein WCO23_03740 [bacterium]